MKKSPLGGSFPKWVLQGKKLVAQKIRGKYLQNLGGDLAPLSAVSK